MDIISQTEIEQKIEQNMKANHIRNKSEYFYCSGGLCGPHLLQQHIYENTKNGNCFCDIYWDFRDTVLVTRHKSFCKKVFKLLHNKVTKVFDVALEDMPDDLTPPSIELHATSGSILGISEDEAESIFNLIKSTIYKYSITAYAIDSELIGSNYARILELMSYLIDDYACNGLESIKDHSDVEQEFIKSVA